MMKHDPNKKGDPLTRLSFLYYVLTPVGFEPTTLRLKGGYSTAELRSLPNTTNFNGHAAHFQGADGRLFAKAPICPQTTL